MAYINSEIYQHGIDDRLKSANRLFLVLLSSSDTAGSVARSNILAFSGEINNNVIKTGNASGAISSSTVEPVFSYDPATKTLTINEIVYKCTVDNIGTSTGEAASAAASGFAIVRSDTSADLSGVLAITEGTEKTYIYGLPSDSSFTVMLSGSLSNKPTINDSSNFKFNKTTITFSEADA